MAKKKIDKGNEVEVDFEGLAADIGGDILDKIDSVSTWIDTGNLALNFACSGRFCGGGVPSGRIIELFGMSSSCKTLFATNILRGVQKCGGIGVFIDAENSLSKEFAIKVSGLSAKQTIIVKVDSLEKGFAKIHTIIRVLREKVAKEKPIVIVYDSIAASPSERESVEVDMMDLSLAARKAAGGGVTRPGERAKVISEQLRVLGGVLDKNNVSVIFINQLRSKIGVMFGPTESPTGGTSIPYYASLRMQTRASKRIKDSLDNVIGIRVNVSNVKNKCFKPFQNVESMFLFFDMGIAPFSGMLDSLVRSGRITGSKGNYKVGLEYTGGEEVSFKSSQERNDVPAEVLLQCPKLVDAEDVSDVQYYIDMFGKATSASQSTLAEQDIVDEQELDG
jgi:recombination protein RecA